MKELTMLEKQILALELSGATCLKLKNCIVAVYPSVMPHETLVAYINFDLDFGTFEPIKCEELYSLFHVDYHLNSFAQWGLNNSLSYYKNTTSYPSMEDVRCDTYQFERVEKSFMASWRFFERTYEKYYNEYFNE